MPASRKQQSGKHRFGCVSCALPCHGATLFGYFSAKMLATEAISTHGIWPAVVFGLLWTRAKARAQTLDE